MNLNIHAATDQAISDAHPEPFKFIMLNIQTFLTLYDLTVSTRRKSQLKLKLEQYPSIPKHSIQGKKSARKNDKNKNVEGRRRVMMN